MEIYIRYKFHTQHVLRITSQTKKYYTTQCYEKTSLVNLEGSDGVCSKFHDVHKGDMHHSVCLGATIRPILVTLDLQ